MNDKAPQQQSPGICGVIFGVIVLIVIFGWLFGGCEEEDKTQKPHSTKLSKNAVRQIVMDKMGVVDREGVKRISEISIIPKWPGHGMGKGTVKVFIVFAADEGGSAEDIRYGICDKIKETAPALRDRFPQMGCLKFVATIPVKDVYGDVTEQPVLRAEYPRETLEKMQFENLYGDEVTALAEDYYFHSEFFSD